MNNINFFEVISANGKFMGAYSREFDFNISIGIGALEMAKINAKQSGGSIYSVDFDGERELIWPK